MFGERDTETGKEFIVASESVAVTSLGFRVVRDLAPLIESDHGSTEYAEGREKLNFTAFDPTTEHPVIDLMREQRGIDRLGGTMRLGAYPCKVTPGTKGAAAYGEEVIYERHRHRYEVNNEYRDKLTAAGLVISGLSPDGRLVEMVELPDHPWFLGNQGHPEFKSRPTRPAPLFRDFIGAAVARKQQTKG